MVIVKGENRYYGRTATGNAPLNEADVARLYQRRREWEVDRDRLLTEEMSNSPAQLNTGPGALMYVFARPVQRQPRLFDNAVKAGQTRHSLITKLIEQVSESTLYPRNYEPDFYTPDSIQIRAEGILAVMGIRKPEDIAGHLNLQIDFDGSGHLFCGRAADVVKDELVFFGEIVVGNVTRFAALLGELYEQAGFIGSVDMGMAITGINGAVPHTENFVIRFKRKPYDRNEYRATDRFSALQLKDDPHSVPAALLTRLFDAMYQNLAHPLSKPKTA